MILKPTNYGTNPIHNLGQIPEVTTIAATAMDVYRIGLAGIVLAGGKHYGPNTRKDLLKKERENLEEQRKVEDKDFGNGLNHYSKDKAKLKYDIGNYYPLGDDLVNKSGSMYSGSPILDVVTLIDIDAKGSNEGILKIELPFIPKELEWGTNSSFVPIKSMGRNNPFYHYTGSEDNLEFEIDWHSQTLDRDDVITKCRLIESLAKGDGYKSPPHRVMLSWGEENVLFQDMVFIVTSANYRLTQFNKAQFYNNNLQRTAMLPIQAYQKVTLSRITTSNLTSLEIQSVKSTKYY